MNAREPFRTFLLGLAIGVLGSYSDDLLGGSAAVSVLQIALWVVSAVVLVSAVFQLRGRRAITYRQLHPTV
jgi:hypothetical protein